MGIQLREETTMRTTTGAYEVWCETYPGDNHHQTRLIAAFQFMPEALDFIGYATAKGVRAILRKPGYRPSSITISDYPVRIATL